MSEQYSTMAQYYDRLMTGVDYDDFAKYLQSLFFRFGKGRLAKAFSPVDGAEVAHNSEAANSAESTDAAETSDDAEGVKSGNRPIVLDMACGSGGVTLALTDLGYDMIGLDLSPEMLMAAREKASDGREILWLCQDMRSMELYGTVDAVVCCLDGINYLTDKGGLESCFSLVHNYLDPDGLFIFDVNTPWKFEHVYGERDYLLEGEGVVCGWRNTYNQRTKLCRFDLTFFVERPDGAYDRLEETQKERCWPENTIAKALRGCGFELLGVFNERGEAASLEPECERWFFAARALK